MRYRWKTGMLAWILFRVTGLALVGYLAMHIMVISNLHDPNKFNSTMKFLGSWQFRILELGLFFVVLYHALNGIRVIIVDFFNGSVHQARMFWGLAVLGFVLFIAGAYPMVSHALYWKDVQGGKIKHESPGYGSSKTEPDDQNTLGKSRRTTRGTNRSNARKPGDNTRQLRVSPNTTGSSYNSNNMPNSTDYNHIPPIEPIEPLKPSKAPEPSSRPLQRGGK